MILQPLINQNNKGQQ